MVADQTPQEDREELEGQLALDGFEAQETQEEPRKLNFEITIDPKTDPADPDLDIDTLRAAIDRDVIAAGMKQVADISKAIITTAAEASAAVRNALNSFAPVARAAITAGDIFNGIRPTIDKILQEYPEISWAELTERMRESLAYIEKLKPYLQAELDQIQDTEITLDDIYACMDMDGTTSLSEDHPIAQIIERAKAAMDHAGEKKTAARSKAKATEKGITLTAGGHIASFTADQFLRSLTTDEIFSLPGGATAEYFDESGKLNMAVVTQRDKKLQNITALHSAFFMDILQRVITKVENDPYSDGPIEIYLPRFFTETGIDPRPDGKTRKKQKEELEGQLALPLGEQRLSKILEISGPFDPLVGRTPEGNYYRVLAFESYDSETETAYYRSPYLTRLVEAQAEAHHGNYNLLLHSTAVNERNKAAVELASVILTGVIKRGYGADPIQAQPKKKQTVTTTAPDGTKKKTVTEYEIQPAPAAKQRPITYRVKYSTLIERSPLLRNALQAILDDKTKKNKNQLYNTKLKQTFEAAARIIMEKSDAPAKYKNLRIKSVTPTKSTLNQLFIIQHDGKPDRQ